MDSFLIALSSSVTAFRTQYSKWRARFFSGNRSAVNTTSAIKRPERRVFHVQGGHAETVFESHIGRSQLQTVVERFRSGAESYHQRFRWAIGEANNPQFSTSLPRCKLRECSCLPNYVVPPLCTFVMSIIWHHIYSDDTVRCCGSMQARIKRTINLTDLHDRGSHWGLLSIRDENKSGSLLCCGFSVLSSEWPDEWFSKRPISKDKGRWGKRPMGKKNIERSFAHVHYCAHVILCTQTAT